MENIPTLFAHFPQLGHFSKTLFGYRGKVLIGNYSRDLKIDIRKNVYDVYELFELKSTQEEDDIIIKCYVYGVDFKTLQMFFSCLFLNNLTPDEYAMLTDGIEVDFIEDGYNNLEIEMQNFFQNDIIYTNKC